MLGRALDGGVAEVAAGGDDAADISNWIYPWMSTVTAGGDDFDRVDFLTVRPLLLLRRVVPPVVQCALLLGGFVD